MAELSFKPDLLRKIRKTEKQRKLSAEERRINIAGAFEADEIPNDIVEVLKALEEY